VMAGHPITASPNRGMAEAVSFMQWHRVDSLIVVSKKKELLGFATIYRVLNKFREENAKLADVMEPFEHVVESGSSVSSALALMNEHRLPYLPVVRGAEFVGLITKGSIVRHLAETYNADDSVASGTEGGDRT